MDLLLPPSLTQISSVSESTLIAKYLDEFDDSPSNGLLSARTSNDTLPMYNT